MSAKQSLMLSWTNLRSIPVRAVSSIVAMVGFAGVATLFVVLLSGREAIRATYELAGRDTVAAVMSGTSTWEAASFIPPPLMPELEGMPGIAHSADGPAISKELTSGASARLQSKMPGRPGPTVNARGVTPAAFQLRRGFRVVSGRAFGSGKHEAIVGRALAEQYGVHEGSKVRLGRVDLEVVGIFESPGGTANMEVWLDKKIYEGLLIRPMATDAGPAEAFDPASILWVKLDGATGQRRLQEAIAASTTALMKSTRLRVVTERQLFTDQSQDLVKRAGKAALAVGLVMGLGALFGAINTMYAAVAHRSREIATLRALGFQVFPISVSVIVEALVLSLVGGLLGTALAVLIIHNMAFTVYNPGANAQITLHFAPNLGIVAGALGYVLLLGLISSILPCMRALRGPIPAGLFAR